MNPSKDIASRAVAALFEFGFIAGHVRVERIARCVRVELPEGPALDARLVAAGAALTSAGLAFDVHAAQRALVAFSPIVAL